MKGAVEAAVFINNLVPAYPIVVPSNSNRATEGNLLFYKNGFSPLINDFDALLVFTICSNDQNHYKADWQSLKNYQVPDWYKEAKLGIFIHWFLNFVSSCG